MGAPTPAELKAMPDRGILTGDPVRALADAALLLYKAASALAGVVPVALAAPPPALSSVPTLAEMVNRLVESKARAGRCDAYLQQLHHCYKHLCRGRGSRPVNQVTTAELEDWVYSGKVSPRTVKGRVQYLNTLFTYAGKLGFCPNNPARALEVPTLRPDPPGIHTPEEVRKVLAEAMKQHRGGARCLAIRYFAGLRASEVEKLPPEAIDLARLRIEVSARISKTRSRRLVTIQPNLAAWIEATKVMPADMWKRVEKVWRAAGVPWPRNAPRHSFVSYHLAHFGSSAKTAMESGHSEQMLFAHYRALVTPEAAAEYWGIRPASAPPEKPEQAAQAKPEEPGRKA